MLSMNRLRYKIFTSFAIAALGAIALVRLALSVPLSGAAVMAFLVGGVIVVAATWRGLIYLRAARSAASS